MKKVLSVVVFIALWVGACLAPEFLLGMESDLFMMAYGFAAGTIAMCIADSIWWK